VNAAGRRHAQRLQTEQKRGSGEQAGALEPRFLVVGQIVGAHGVRGELRVEILTQDPHRFGLLEQVYIGLEDQEPVPWSLESYRLHKSYALLKLTNCDDRTAAQELHGTWVQVPIDQALPLDEDEYYEYQFLGLEVWTAEGEHLGEVVEIIATGANDVYVVRRPDANRRDLLLPAIEEVVKEIDMEGGRMVVELMDGLDDG